MSHIMVESPDKGQVAKGQVAPAGKKPAKTAAGKASFDAGSQVLGAVAIYCDLEFATPGGKVDTKKISQRLGIEHYPELYSNEVFLAALDIERSLRNIEHLPHNVFAIKALDAVCNLGLRYLANQLVLANLGYKTDIRTSSLMRDLPKLLHLKWEREGLVNSIGVDAGVLIEKVEVQLEDPHARALAYKILGRQLLEREVGDMLDIKVDIKDEKIEESE